MLTLMVRMINCQNIHMLCTYKYILCFIIQGGGVDYNSGPYNITFPIGSTIASFDITIIDDNVFEFDEMFSISITSITNGHIVGTPAVATVTIIDTTSKCVHNFILCTVCTYVYNIRICIFVHTYMFVLFLHISMYVYEKQCIKVRRQSKAAL